MDLLVRSATLVSVEKYTILSLGRLSSPCGWRSMSFHCSGVKQWKLRSLNSLKRSFNPFDLAWSVGKAVFFIILRD